MESSKLEIQSYIYVEGNKQKAQYGILNFPLGKGSFAITQLGVVIDDPNSFVAVQIVNTQTFVANINDPQQQSKRINSLLFELDKQLRIWKEVNHVNVVRFYDYSISKTNVYFISELCTDGDVQSLRKVNPIIDEYNAIIIFKQLIDGVKHLYDLGIYHRDLKPSNILKSGNIFQIADFGFAKQLDGKSQDLLNINTFLGTPLYMSPQILNGEKYSIKTDVWSLGIIFYELVSGVYPWAIPLGASHKDLLQAVVQKPQVTFPHSINLGEPIKALIQSMLQVVQVDRISIVDAKSIIDQIYENLVAKVNSQMKQEGISQEHPVQ